MKGLGCAIHICYRISAPAPSGRNLCPPNKKAEKHQLAAIIPGSPNTSKSQRSMRDHAAWHHCFSRFSGVFSSGFWLLSLAQSPAAPCLGTREHIMDPHVGTQSCCLPEAPCTLPSVQHPRPQGSSSLLHCRGPK